jgi:hypothetical protein
MDEPDTNKNNDMYKCKFITKQSKKTHKLKTRSEIKYMCTPEGLVSQSQAPIDIIIF